MDLDRTRDGVEAAREVGVGVGIEAHFDGAANHWAVDASLGDQRRAGKASGLAEGLIERHRGVGQAQHAADDRHHRPGELRILVPAGAQPLPPMRTTVRAKKITATDSKKKNMNRFLLRCWRCLSLSPGRRPSSAMALTRPAP